MSAADIFALGGQQDDPIESVLALSDPTQVPFEKVNELVLRVPLSDCGRIALASLQITHERLGKPEFAEANMTGVIIALGCLQRIAGHWISRCEAEKDPVVAFGERLEEIDDQLDDEGLSAEEEKAFREEAVAVENRVVESVATSQDGIALQVCLLRQMGNELEWQDEGTHGKLCTSILAGLAGLER